MGKMLVFSMHSTPVMFSVFIFIFWYWNTLEKEILKHCKKGCRYFLFTDIRFRLSKFKDKERKLQPQITGRLTLHYQTIIVWQKHGEFCKAGLVDAAPAQLGAADDLGSYSCCDRERAACAIKSLHEAWTRLGKNLGFAGF